MGGEGHDGERGAAAPVAEAFRGGLAAQQAGNLPLAIEGYRRAMGLGGMSAALLNNLGGALRELGRPREALESLELCAKLYPDHAGCRSNLGLVLLNLGRLDEAVHRCREAAALLPGSPPVQFNLGCVLLAMERDAEAAAAFERAIRLDPGHVEAHSSLAHALLRLGEFGRGLAEFEWRARVGRYAGAWAAVTNPFWRGEALTGRRLVIDAEQGMGDVIQFVRYVPRIAALGGRVTLRVYPALVRLMRSLDAPVEVTSTADPKPAADCELMLMSAPLALGDGGIAAAASYLSAPPAETAAWKRRFADLKGLRVGIVWAGAHHADDADALRIDGLRNLPPERLAGLAGVPGVSWVCLQKNAPAEGLDRVPPEMGLSDGMAEVPDFAAAAAVVEALDLVITVDTAAAHLAGAMGKPVWILSRFNGCWRWLLHRADSPWYPSARIYRQAAPGAWDKVIAEVACDLERVAAGHGS